MPSPHILSRHALRACLAAGVALAAFAGTPALAAPPAAPASGPAASGPVVVLVRVHPAPGREDELQALYLQRLDYLRKAEPEASFRLHRSTKEPASFLWYEVYPSQAAYEHHVRDVLVAYKKAAGPTPAGLLAGPSDSETWVELGR